MDPDILCKPSETQSLSSFRFDFYKHLIVSTSNTPCLNFDNRHNVVHCFFKYFQRFFSRRLSHLIKGGLLHGRATLERSSESERGRTQYWSVVATDDEGDVVSDGTIVTKIVSLVQLERLKEEREQREAPAC